MRLTLAWSGPIGAGLFPDDPVALEAMFAPGVYLRVKSYERGRTVSYVGQSRNLMARMDQHLTGLLGLQHVLRDAAGEVRMRGDFDARLRCYGDIVEAARLAAEEAGRMRFYWAPCDDSFHVEHLGVVEASLKERLELMAASADGAGANENRQGVPVGALDEPVFIESDFGALGAADAELLTRLIGEALIVYELDEVASGIDA